MAFRKTAYIESLGSANFDKELGLKKIALSNESAADNQTPKTYSSYFIDGSRKINVVELLKEAANKFDISADPHDYIYEAIRANTVNVPNDNHDGFHKNELLRFDNKLRKAVYLTYEGKPHHLNHQTSDAKRARGVILQAHYNDSAAPLENCPKCKARTAEETGRDPTGIHCAACFTTVRDEFVEILVAVDTKKDPDLVRGIQAGILNAGSMGCNCASTVCNICSHVARSVDEFCNHIRAGSKGSLWTKNAGSKDFKRSTTEEVRNTLKRAGISIPYGQSLIDVSLILPDGFEVRKAFEYCQGVEFDEYSRVHRPADPKARTTEILKAAGADTNPSISIEEETKALLLRATAELQNTKKEASSPMSKFYAVRVNSNNDEIYVGPSLTTAAKSAELGKRDSAEYFCLEANTEKQALTRAISASLSNSAQYLPVTSDVTLQVPEGAKVQIDEAGNISQVDENGQPLMPGQMGGPGMGMGMGGPAPGDPNGVPGTPGAPGSQPGSIEDLTQKKMEPANPEQSPEEFGMLPPGASLEMEGEGDKDKSKENGEEDMEQKFASAYEDFELDIFDKTATLRSPAGEVLNVVAGKALTTRQDKETFGLGLLASLKEVGLVRTAMKYKASFSSKIADITDGYMHDMKERRPMENGGIVEGYEHDMVEMRDTSPADDIRDGYEDDMTETRTVPESFISDRDTDMASGEAQKQDAKSITQGHEEDMKEGREEFSVGSEDITTGYVNDMKTKGGEAKSASTSVSLERQRKLYASRLEGIKAEYEAREADLKATLKDQFSRALKIASKRHLLNLEISPLKAKVIDSLTVTRPVGRNASTGETLEWTGMDEGLALHLVEAAWAEANEEEIDTLVSRAAEFMNYDEKYLASAESDLAKSASVIPQVVSSEQLEPVDHWDRKAEELHRQASASNLEFSPSPTEDSELDTRASKIRQALSLTKTAQLSQRMSEVFN